MNDNCSLGCTPIRPGGNVVTWIRGAKAGCALILVCVLCAGVTAAPPTFENDVMAVLSKAGCNMGACHGNQNGKGGLRLSLRGQDPAYDFAQLARQYQGRRVDRFVPDASLVLLKPLGQVAHEGGTRFQPDWIEYEILRDWIAAGAPGPRGSTPQLEQLRVTPKHKVVIAPDDRVQLKATALFSNGSVRDVTRLAVYEPSTLSVDVDRSGLVRRSDFGEVTVTVRYLNRQVPVTLAFIPERADFVWAAPAANNYVDKLLFAKLKTLRINPSPLVSDGQFVRRAYLDAIGMLPTVEETKAFISSDQPGKRATLIDHLLERPEFAERWALKWSDVLRNEEKVLDPKGVDAFYAWIRDGIAAGKPVDQFVRELITGRGSTYENPPANYYRAARDPLARGETTALLFLGTRLQCAKCHNHPFDRWTQQDYYSWAAWFSRVDYEIIENKRKDKLDKNEFQGKQIVLIQDEGEVKNPVTGENATPCFLGQDAPASAASGDRLESLADWLTSSDNHRFASAQVNWIWFHLMGRGLVDPVDDFRATNPAVNPPLLEALADDFIASGFDLRHVVRTIMSSRTYQLSAEPNETNRDDTTNFSRALVSRLTAEQLLDAQRQVLEVPADFNGYPTGTRAGQVAGVLRVRLRDKPLAGGDRFLRTFGRPQRLLPGECERSNTPTLSQAFTLISGRDLNRRIAEPEGRVHRLATSDRPAREAVDELFWAALCRAPNDEERQAALDRVAQTDSVTGLQDLAWALLNAKEFVFRW